MSTQKNPTLQDALDRIKELEARNKDLESRNRDLGSQVTELGKGKPMNETEWAMFRNQTKHIEELQGELNELAMWLRGNRAAEIGRGEHEGMTLVKVIVRYLARGLELERAKGTVVS